MGDLVTTPFGPESTAADVIAGVDLSGRSAIVTGASSGIGVETARALAAAGASVTLAVRDASSGERVAGRIRESTGNGAVTVGAVDLSDLSSVAAFVRAWTGPLDILVNNAGVMAVPELTMSPSGHEMQFATNHLGHFALTVGLHKALAAAGDARIVSVSSGGHLRSPVVFDDIDFAFRDYNPFAAYGQSKTANVLFAVELDRRWAEDGIRGYAVHPGIVVGTGLGPSRTEDGPAVTEDQLRAMGLVDDSGRPIIEPDRERKTPQQGASTSVFAATSPLLAGIGGVYLKDNDISPLDTPKPINFGAEDDIPADVVPYAVDPESARRLWELSVRLLQ
jgi:NAD(P)-dependent dehydrogenase (short-subunit alcohol dehydrogenase family)